MEEAAAGRKGFDGYLRTVLFQRPSAALNRGCSANAQVNAEFWESGKKIFFEG
jgi:hypothetical protein